MRSLDIHLKLADSVAPFADLPCVGGRMYLGSMFYLDFGALIKITNKNGSITSIGEMSISVRDVEWSFFSNDGVTISAETGSEEEFNEFVSRLFGTTIASFSLNAENTLLEINFGTFARLSIDLLNSWKTDSDILEVAFPDGRIVAVSESGGWIADGGVDADRLQRWNQRKASDDLL